MEINMLLWLILFVFLLLLPSEMVMQVVAKECKYRSRLFRGLCFDDDKCYIICQSEGFERGQCEGIIRHCMCTKICGSPPGEPPPYGEEPPPPYGEEPSPPYGEEPTPPYGEEPPPPYGEEPPPPSEEPALSYERVLGGSEDGKRRGSAWGGGGGDDRD